MKQIIIALAMVGLACSGAEAKTKIKIKGGAPSECMIAARKTTHHKFAKVNHRPIQRTVSYGNSHRVCEDHGGYYTCCVYTDKTHKRW
jgi:hypothetical protein